MKVTLNFIKAVDELAEKITGSEINAYVIQLMDALLERLSKGDFKDLKEIDTIGIAWFLNFLNKISKRYKDVEKKDIRSEIEVVILTNHLKSENFAWRNNAIEAIKTKYDFTTIRIDFDNL